MYSVCGHNRCYIVYYLTVHLILILSCIVPVVDTQQEYYGRKTLRD